MLPFAVLGASLLISYLRAKAESLGLEAKGGLMERAERVIVLCVGLAFSPALVVLLWVMLGLTLVTAGQRFAKVWRQASAAEGLGAYRSGGRAVPGRVAGRAAVGATEPAPVAERWRAWREGAGWTPRAERYDRGGRSGAAERWRERRQQRQQTASDRPSRRGTRRP
jgi:hypothetical protein